MAQLEGKDRVKLPDIQMASGHIVHRGDAVRSSGRLDVALGDHPFPYS